jgi:hypothetical protein
MRTIITILMIMASITVSSQVVYSWTNGVDPGWTSTNSGPGGALDWNPLCNAVTTNCTGNYSNFQNTTYTSGVIDTECLNASTVIISFDIVGNAEFQFDFLFMEYSLDGGTSWTDVYGPGIGITGNAGGGTFWTLPPLPTSPNFSFRFNFDSDFAFTELGYQLTDFTISCNPQLPVELIDFDAFSDGTYVSLEWSTFSESNNSHFIIEKSVDGESWKHLIKVYGKGNSTELSEYRTTDDIPSVTTYYRLTQYDYDGKKEVLGIESVKGELNVSLIKTVNYLGQEVNESYRGVVIDIFSDNATRKRFQ